MKPVFYPFCTPLNFWSGTASVFFSSHITPLHSHDALQLVIALNGAFLFRTVNTNWEEYQGIIIKENVVHQLNTHGSIQLIIYIDGSSQAAQQLKSSYLKDEDFQKVNIAISPLEEMLIHRNLIERGERSIKLLIELIFDRLNTASDCLLNNKRITRVLQLIKQTEPADLSIGLLASKVFISPSRLRMQFKQALGVSLHQYIIRHKILMAITGMVNGSSIQDAAYRSGFNDSSHLNKLIQKTFDINPSVFLKDNKSFSVVRHDNSFEFKTELALNDKK